MGNEQSGKTNDPRQARREQENSEIKMQRLLEAQRRLYERKCEELVKSQIQAQEIQAARSQAQVLQAAQSLAQATQAAQSQAQTTRAALSQAQATQAGQSQAQANQAVQSQAKVPQPVHNLTSGTVLPNLERQPAPYNYANKDLQNLVRGNPANAPNLYPNLHQPHLSRPAPNAPSFERIHHNPVEGFVFVNNQGRPQGAVPCAPRPRDSSSGRVVPSAPPRPRNRSVSRGRNDNSDEEVKCPTCNRMFGLQIFQCNSGHSSCKTCKDHGKSCFICGNVITAMRNITLESYMAERKVPCPNTIDGCALLIKMADLEFHVKECPFNEIQCPLSCCWRGKLKQLAEHFDRFHPQQRVADVDKEIRLQDIHNNSQNVYLILLGSFNFLLHVKVSQVDRKVYMAGQLIGTKISASKWLYEVHVYNKNECRRKYMFSDVCSSFNEPVDDFFREGKCSVLQQDYASTFVCNGALCYKIFFKRANEDKLRGNFRNQHGNRNRRE